MSRQAQLPPRCPLQRKSRPQAPQSFATPSQFEFRPQHHRSSSLGSISDEQPAWLDDLLNDSKGLSHRRSASDSVALSDASVDNLQPPTTHSDEVSSISPDSTGLDSACLYGPSSPRKKGNPSFSDNAIVSILSEYVSQSPLKSADGSVHISRFTGFGMTKDEGSAAELNAKIEIVKRHSGQRSRVRKLQYIAELESTVNALQTMESDLAIRVRSLSQQRLALSLEKSKLKQQVARLQQEKFILDGEYLHLKRDFEILKSVLPEGSTSKLRAQFGSAIAAEHPETAWNLLDMGKLNLN